VWAVGPPTLQLRVRTEPPQLFRSDGGAHFQPETFHYTSSRCKPPTAEWIRSRNPLEKIVAGCADRDLRCRIMVSVSHAGRTAERHPAFATKNALGLESRHAICPLNPDVQAWLLGLMSDLSTNYEPDAVVLSDLVCSWPDVSEVGMASCGSRLALLEHLLATCMCESCRQGAAKAGVDVKAVERDLTGQINRATRGDTGGRSPKEEPQTHPEIFASYLAWQSDALVGLVRELCRTATCEILLLDDRRDGARPSWGSEIAADGPRIIRRQVDDLEVLKEQTNMVAREEVRIVLTDELLREGSSLVHDVTSLAERGYAGVMLDHFGAIPQERDSAVRQAVRFARRTTDS